MSFAFKICLCIGLVVISLLCLSANAFEENEKFCIRTEPMLLSDLTHNDGVDKTDSQCEITATTLTSKEKESFINTMCRDLNSTVNIKDYHYFELYNGELAGRRSYHHICHGKSNPLLAWLPFKEVQKSFATELNPKEHLFLIAKAYDRVTERNDLCYFQHYDLANNISDSYFGCTLMVFEDNFFSVNDHVQVLVEIKPLMYEIKNITYLPWVNVTKSYKTILGKSLLKNTNREKKQIFGSVPYAFVEKVHLNTSSIYHQSAAHLPLLFEHKGSVLQLDGHGFGGLELKEKAYFGRTMDPKSSVNVDIIGQWAEHTKQFNAELYEYFGYGIKRFYREVHHGEVTFVRIESTEPVYEMIESSNAAKSTLHRFHESKSNSSERLSDMKVSKATAGEWSDITEGPQDDRVYPNFYPWFIAGCIVVALTIIATLIGAVRSCSKTEDQQKYQLANKA